MAGAHLILYDGDCSFCNRFVQFVLKRDRKAQFLFAPLQSEIAKAELAQQGFDPAKLDTVYVIFNRGTAHVRLSMKARAVLLVMRALGGAWRIPAVLRYLPAGVLDGGYDFIARHRHRLGSSTCIVLKPEHRDRFLF